MKAMVIRIIIGALGTVIKWLEKRLKDLEVRGCVKTIQTTALLRSDRILKKVLEIGVTCCHSDSSERPLSNADVKNSQGIKIINGSTNLSRTTRPSNNQQEKENKQNCEHRVKLRESGRKHKYIDLARKLKKKQLWIMKVTFIPIVIGTLGTVTKWLIKGLDGLKIRRRVESIQTIV